jgi:hypothetical protein
MEVLGQITPDGGISAGYVLAGVISIAMFLFWNTINGMRGDIKEIKKDVNDLRASDQAREQRLRHIESQQEQTRENEKSNQQLLTEIAIKLQLLKG